MIVKCSDDATLDLLGESVVIHQFRLLARVQLIPPRLANEVEDAAPIPKLIQLKLGAARILHENGTPIFFQQIPLRTIRLGDCGQSHKLCDGERATI